MLEIDYELIELSEADLARLDREASQLARRGQPPPIPPSFHGRVAVVNPNPKHELHHVPDPLRKPLRRVLVHTVERGRELKAQELLERIHEGEEKLFCVVIEAHQPFAALEELLRLLPGLKKSHPYCRFIFHGSGQALSRITHHLVEQAGGQAQFYFPHQPQPVAVQSPGQLGGLVAARPKYPTFGQPLFTRFVLKMGRKAEPFNVAGLKRLYPLFGLGWLDELDLSQKQRDQLMAVELPTSQLSALALAPVSSHGLTRLVVGGEALTPEAFRQNQLENRDIGLNKLEKLVRRRPVHGDEEIPLSLVRAIRVRCLDGAQTLVWKASPDFLPLFDVCRMAFQWPAPSGGGGQAGALSFDFVSISEEDHPRIETVRAAIRQTYLKTLFEQNLARTIRLQKFSTTLKVACLGPLAAQTLKLMIPLGMGNYIPVEKVFYLSDSIDHLEAYNSYQVRLKALFNELAGNLKSIFVSDASRGFNLSLISHKMPLVQDWVEGKTPPFEQLKAENLDSLYNELKAFLLFSETEFKRVDPQDADIQEYFERLVLCDQTLLLAKQLSNLITHRYGHFFQAGDFPDFVFFGAKADFTRNLASYRLPGMDWESFFGQGELAKLFGRNDYAFSIFLEEQLALFENQMRQELDLVPTQKNYGLFFQAKAQDFQNELKALEAASKPGEAASNSAAYQDTFNRLKAEHLKELEAYRLESQGVLESLREVEEDYFGALAEITAFLEQANQQPLADGEEAAWGEEDYLAQLDQRLSRHGVLLLKTLDEAVERTRRESNQELSRQKELLNGYLKAFVETQKRLFPWRREEHHQQLMEEIQAKGAYLLQELNRAAQLSAEEGQTRLEGVRRERLELKRNLLLIEANLVQMINKSQQSLQALRQGLARVMVLFDGKTEANGAQGVGRLERIQQRQRQAAGELERMMDSARESHQGLSSALKLLYRKKLETALLLHKNANLVEVLEGGGPALPITQWPVAPELPEAQGALEPLEEALNQARRQWEQLGQNLKSSLLPQPLSQETQAAADHFGRFEKLFNRYQDAIRHRKNHLSSAKAIFKRLERMEAETQDLDNLIHQRTIPAYRMLCTHFFIPRARRRLEYAAQANLFMEQLGRIPFDAFQKEFLTRAIFKRFSKEQFRQGVYCGLDPSHPRFNALRNLMQAMFLFLRILRHNLDTGQGEPTSLEKVPMTRPAEILRYCEAQLALPVEKRRAYLVLPATLSLMQAVDVITRKEQLFNGLPQLVMIYLSRFDNSHIQTNPTLRDNYFAALKHNIILNMNNPGVVDSPNGLALKLVDQTLGSAFDLEKIGYPSGAGAANGG